MIGEMKMKCILYPILSCIPVQFHALVGYHHHKQSIIDQEIRIRERREKRDRYNNFLANKKIKNLEEFVLEVKKALDDKNNEDVKFISDNVINILNDNKIIIGKNKFITDDKKQEFIKNKIIKNLNNLKNRYSETMEIKTLEDFIYCITKLTCSTDYPQIRKFKIALLTEVETKKIDNYYYCYFSPQAVILNMILQPDFKVDEKLPQNIKDFIGKTIKKSELESYRVRAASIAKSVGFSVKSFLVGLDGTYIDIGMLDEGTNVLNLISMFKNYQDKNEIARRKAIIDKDANDSEIDKVMQKNDYYTNGYYLTKNFDEYDDIMLTGIAFFQWIDDYLYSFFSDERNNTIWLEDNKYYHLKDKMYEEEYLSKKSKKATKDSIVKKLKENIQYLDEFSEGTAKRTFCDYLLKDDVLNKMIKQYKYKEIDDKIKEILRKSYIYGMIDAYEIYAMIDAYETVNERIEEIFDDDLLNREIRSYERNERIKGILNKIKENKEKRIKN